MNPDAERAMEETRQQLAQRNAEHEPEFYVLVTEAQALDLASGYVPLVIRAMCRTLLEWEDQDQRASERPLPKASRARKRA